MKICPKCWGYKSVISINPPDNTAKICPVCKGEGKVPDDYKPPCKPNETTVKAF